MSRILTALFLSLSVGAATAVELLSQPLVIAAESSATITWLPDVACGTRVWIFFQRAKSGNLLMKWNDADQILRFFDPKRRACTAYPRESVTQNYFCPNSPSYGDRQLGRIIQSEQIPFKS
jgi:hypothetical protein